MVKTPASHVPLEPGSPQTGGPSTPAGGPLRPNLKMLAAHLGLSPSTISLVLNNVPGRSIPEATRERVRAAAREFNYQPSLIARKLQGKRVNTIGIMLPELGEGYHSQVISGAGDLLIREGYFYFTVHHRHRAELVRGYPELLEARGVEGILAIDTHLEESPMLPTVLVAGHSELPGVSNVVLDSGLGRGSHLGICMNLVIGISFTCVGSLSAQTRIFAGKRRWQWLRRSGCR